PGRTRWTGRTGRSRRSSCPGRPDCALAAAYPPELDVARRDARAGHARLLDAVDGTCRRDVARPDRVCRGLRTGRTRRKQDSQHQRANHRSELRTRLSGGGRRVMAHWYLVVSALPVTRLAAHWEGPT